jgi:hypothetical protein
MSENRDTGNILQQFYYRILDYIKARSELVYVVFIERLSGLIAFFIAVLVLFFFAAFALLFISLFAGFYLSELTGSNMTGFGIVGAVYVLAFLILIIFNKSLIRNPLMSSIVRILFDTIEPEQNNNEKGKKS